MGRLVTHSWQCGTTYIYDNEDGTCIISRGGQNIVANRSARGFTLANGSKLNHRGVEISKRRSMEQKEVVKAVLDICCQSKINERVEYHSINSFVIFGNEDNPKVQFCLYLIGGELFIDNIPVKLSLWNSFILRRGIRKAYRKQRVAKAVESNERAIALLESKNR